MYRSRRNSVRISAAAPASFGSFGRFGASPTTGSSDRPPRSRASEAARASSVAPGGVSVPPAHRASRTRASHDSAAAAASPSPAAAGTSRRAAASHRPDGAGATDSAPTASPATPRARMHATHAESTSAKQARERAVRRSRRIAAVTRAGHPIGRRVLARLSHEREIRSAFRVQPRHRPPCQPEIAAARSSATPALFRLHG